MQPKKMGILTGWNGGKHLTVSKAHLNFDKVSSFSEIRAETDIEILLRTASPGHNSDKQLENPESKTDTSLLDLIVEGSIQQAIALLPYIPNILVKLGPRGVLCVRLAPKAPETNGANMNELRLQGVKVDVVVRY